MVCKFKGKEMHQTISLNINCAIIGEYAPEEILVDNYVSFFFFLTGTHSIQGWTASHYKAWSYKKKKQKKIKVYRKSL